MSPEGDGIVRRVALLIGQKIKDEKVKMYPALPLEALRVAMEKKIYKVKSFGERTQEGYGIQSITLGDYTIPTDTQGKFQVYYAGHRKGLYVPAWQVMEGKLSPEVMKDKIVLVGTSAIGLLDLRASPLDVALPGVEVHAEVIEQILDRKFLNRPGFFDGAEILVTVAISLFIIFLTPFIGTATLALLVSALIAMGGGVALYAYQAFGYLLDPVYPTLTIVTIFILSSILTNLRTEMERRAVRNALVGEAPGVHQSITVEPMVIALPTTLE